MSRPVALVTGASRGIGRAVAQALSPTHHVLVGGRDADLVTEVVRSLESAEPFVVDLIDERAVTAALTGIERLDVLVHSAGLVAFGSLAESTTQEWRDLLELNVLAPVTLTRLLLPALRAAHGLVVFIKLRCRAGHAPRLLRVLGVQVRADRARGRAAAGRTRTGAGHLDPPRTGRHRHAGRVVATAGHAVRAGRPPRPRGGRSRRPRGCGRPAEHQPGQHPDQPGLTREIQTLPKLVLAPEISGAFSIFGSICRGGR